MVSNLCVLRRRLSSSMARKPQFRLAMSVSLGFAGSVLACAMMRSIVHLWRIMMLLRVFSQRMGMIDDFRATKLLLRLIGSVVLGRRGILVGGNRHGSRGERCHGDGKRSLEGKVSRGSQVRNDVAVGEPVTKQRWIQPQVQHTDFGLCWESSVPETSDAVVVPPVGQVVERVPAATPVARRALFQEAGVADPGVSVVDTTVPVVPGSNVALVEPTITIVSMEVDASVGDGSVAGGGESSLPTVEGLVLVDLEDKKDNSAEVIAGGLSSPVAEAVLDTVKADGSEVAMGETDQDDSSLSGEDLSIAEADMSKQVSGLSLVDDAGFSLVEKARKGKGALGIQGMGSRKLNVYIRTPRKRLAPKGNASTG